jgi:ribosomal protein S18 acetylase RimI-like enzyme
VRDNPSMRGGEESSNNKNPVIRRANQSELSVVLDILTEAATWQAAEREAVWPIPFPRTTVEASIARAETYVLCRTDIIIGTVALCWDDPAWDEQSPDSGYVHRLAVSRGVSGDGLGGTMLAWAERQVADAGRTWLRLDCPASNQGLRAYYGQQGFELVREIDVTSPPEFGACVTWHLALQQRRVRL